MTRFEIVEAMARAAGYSDHSECPCANCRQHAKNQWRAGLETMEAALAAAEAMGARVPSDEDDEFPDLGVLYP